MRVGRGRTYWSLSVVTVFIVLVVLSFVSSHASHAAKRVALVIGQSNYAGLSRLNNSANDARKMANVLADHGFDLIACDGQEPPCLDLTRSGMLRALTALELAADGAELALVFYAGHGMEGDGGNVLAPIDATVDCATQQVARGVLLEQFILASSPARNKVIILDACRDNPLAQICPPVTGKERKPLSFKDIKVPDARDFLLLTSTKPGQQAQDGVPGTNSPFAKSLFAELETRPEIYFDQLFNYVARAVVEATRNSSPTQLPEALVRGGAPRDCLRGRDCAADPHPSGQEYRNEYLQAYLEIPGAHTGLPICPLSRLLAASSLGQADHARSRKRGRGGVLHCHFPLHEQRLHAPETRHRVRQTKGLVASF